MHIYLIFIKKDKSNKTDLACNTTKPAQKVDFHKYYENGKRIDLILVVVTCSEGGVLVCFALLPRVSMMDFASAKPAWTVA